MSNVAILPKLPKTKNGLGPLAAQVIDAAGNWTEEAGEKHYALVELTTFDKSEDLEGKVGVRFHITHAELLGDDDMLDPGAYLQSAYDERRANGQMSLDDASSSVIPELLAEISELSDDLNIDEQELADEFETTYGSPPSGCGNEVWLREFVHTLKARLVAAENPVTDLALPADDVVHTTNTPAGEEK